MDDASLIGDLRERETRLNAFFQGAPIPTFVIDQNRRVRRWNRALEALTGMPAADVMGTKEHWRAFYTEERPCLADLLLEGDPTLVSRWYGEKKIRTGLIDGAMEATDFFPNMGKNGKWLRVTASVIRSSRGEVLGAVETMEDVTDQKLAEAALRDNEEKYRLFSEMAPVGVMIENHAKKNLYVSQKFADMFGYTNEELQSAKAWWSLAYPDTSLREKIRRKWAATVAEAKKTNFEIRPFEAPVTCKDGTVRDIEFRMRIADKLNFIMLTDITERKQAEAEREKLQAQLTQAQKMESVGRLAGGVAHDFNNMLTVIMGHAELAMDQVGPDHFLYEDLQEIYRAAERSADLTRQLLAFARKQTIAPRVLDLNETVEGMFRMLQRLIGENIDLIWEPATRLWPVKMDPSQIDQILANLCVNAKDALADGGQILIKTGNQSLDETFCADYPGFVAGDYVLLFVSDNGCGMNREVLANLFEPFFTTKKTGEGTGLGLATIYGIVKQNNGFIYVDSEPGQGSVFKIYLPRHAVSWDHAKEPESRPKDVK